MGKIIETKLNRWDGGISEDIRENIANTFAFSKDMKIEKHKMISHRAWGSWTDADEKITRMLYAKSANGTDYQTYGFGGDTNDKPKIFSAVLGATQWTALKTATTGARARNVFFLYKDYVYFWQNSTVLSRMNLVGTPTIAEAYQTIAYANIAQPLHHLVDDSAYFFQDNIVHRIKLNGDWEGSVLTLPDNLKIVGGVAYGNYLVIGCTSVKKDITNSVLYFWDRNSSLATISDKIDLGYGELKHITGSEDGGFYLVQSATKNPSLFGNTESIQLKYYNGSFLLREIKIGSTADHNYFTNFSINSSGYDGNAMGEKDALYFPATLITAKENTSHHGIIKVWREGGQIRWTMDREITGIASNYYINGIYNIEGSWYVFHSSAYTLPQGNNATIEGVYETNRIIGKKRKLIGVTVFTDPFTDAVNKFTLNYRKDNDAAWTKIFSKSTGDDIENSAVRDVDGNTLPEYNAVQFQLKSNSIPIVELSFKEEFVGKAAYD